MFGIGTSELMIILAVGLIVIGPQKLPDLARAIGRAVGEFRKATSEIKETLEGDENLASVKKTFEDAMQEGMTANLVQETPEEAASSTALDNLQDLPEEYGLGESTPEEEEAPDQAATEEIAEEAAEEAAEEIRAEEGSEAEASEPVPEQTRAELQDPEPEPENQQTETDDSPRRNA